MYINEDLTRLRFQMLKMLKQNPETESVYSRDGKLVCKLKGEARRYFVDSPDDLFNLSYDDVDFARLGLDDFTAPYNR